MEEWYGVDWLYSYIYYDLAIDVSSRAGIGTKFILKYGTVKHMKLHENVTDSSGHWYQILWTGITLQPGVAFVLNQQYKIIQAMVVVNEQRVMSCSRLFRS